LPISSRPSSFTEPEAFSSRPTIAAHSVDFPMPLRPMSATGSAPIENDTPWSTWADP
jgi:hypothetical protein